MKFNAICTNVCVVAVALILTSCSEQPASGDDLVGTWVLQPPAGAAVFAADHIGVRCDNVEVLPHHQRKGIATWMYRIASEIFGAPVYPSATRSEDALAFWSDRPIIHHLAAPT
jgi:GNAT superfamily N-acetyltransferase